MSDTRTPMPFSLGLTLDRAIARYRAHALEYMAIAAIMQLPIALTLIITHGTTDQIFASGMRFTSLNDVLRMIVMLICVTFAIHATIIFAQAAITQRAIHIAQAQKPTFAQSFVQIFRHPLRISILSLISFIIHIISLIGCMIIVFYFIVDEIMLFSSQPEHTRLLTGVFLLALYLAMFVVQARVILALPIAIAEQIGVRASINRSWQLTAGAWVPAYLCGAIIVLLYSFCIFAPSLVLGSRWQNFLGLLLIRTILLIICLPIMGLIRLQLYEHQRTRREGDDLAARMAQVGYVGKG
ncbi:hypothetical protein F8S13_24460 [Chloroflexia bacterium SDU3-3]|nr:hypothetical protein F8S13_24460 [Chloroflexia bacterium SDU3-3]